MPQQMIDNEHSGQPWYVMCHLKPQQIETMLQKDSAGLFVKPGDSPLQSYRFYIPFQHMPIIHRDPRSEAEDKRYRAQDDLNALRSDLHSFVFIQASEERVRAIVQSDWNTKANLRLYYYRDTNRNIVTISDTEVRLLMAAIQDHHLRFYIDQPLDDFAAGDRVILKMEPWDGRHGFIKKVALKKGQLCMTISLNILGRTKSINFTDVKTGDVIFEDPERGRMLSDNPITNYEEEIIDILSHRFGHRHDEEVEESDLLRLRRLSTYDHIYVDDADEQARFVALKLICAYLLKSPKKRDLYQQQVLDLLSQDPLPSSTLIPHTSTEAYLMTALFITTRNAHWRTAVKNYRNTHPDAPAILRRYHTIIKDLRAKKPDNVNN